MGFGISDRNSRRILVLALVYVLLFFLLPEIKENRLAKLDLGIELHRKLFCSVRPSNVFLITFWPRESQRTNLPFNYTNK